MDEVEHLGKTYSISYFVFQDDNFFGPGEAGQVRCRRIAKEILRRKLILRFFFCCRLNDVKQETFCLWQEAGLDAVGIGIETTQPESLRLFQKGLRRQEIYPTLELLDDSSDED